MSEVTFRELAQRAQSAGSFIAANAESRAPIACYMEKSTRAIAAMLGAVYAGCCYSVIDVRQPAPRARAVFTASADSGTEIRAAW